MPSIPSQKNSEGKILPRHSAHEPEGLVTTLGEQLRQLGVMAERVDQPAGRDVDPELVAIVPLAVLHLADEGLAARHVVVGHDVERTDELQPSLGQEAAEIRLLGGIPLQERPHVGDLVEREPEARLLSQEPHRLEDVGQSDVKIFLAGLEDGPLPVRVRDRPRRSPSWRGRGSSRKRSLSRQAEHEQATTKADSMAHEVRLRREDRKRDDHRISRAAGPRNLIAQIRCGVSIVASSQRVRPSQA